jgi:tRNA(His) 5'-end guanylyltransferase
MVSVSSSIMAVNFNKIIHDKIQDSYHDSFRESDKYSENAYKNAYFDSRAFNIPKEDVVNYFLWRQKDWARNSIQMYARNFFSQKQLHGKKAADMHEMLYGIGSNWATDLNDQKKNGTFIIRDKNVLKIVSDIVPLYDNLHSLIKPFIETETETKTEIKKESQGVET